MGRSDTEPAVDFIRTRIAEDLAAGRFDGRVATRWPPEPNGYPHIGHATAICLNFEIAAENGGPCHLRLDDTNPAREEEQFVEALKEGIRWLGYDWGEHLYYASDHFGELYEYAVELVRRGKAFVCDLSVEQMREYRGTLTESGKDSPWRNRSRDENLDLLGRMRQDVIRSAQGTISNVLRP